MGKGFAFKYGTQVSTSFVALCARVNVFLDFYEHIPIFDQLLPSGFRLNIMLLFPRCVCSLEKLMACELFKLLLEIQYKSLLADDKIRRSERRARHHDWRIICELSWGAELNIIISRQFLKIFRTKMFAFLIGGLWHPRVGNLLLFKSSEKRICDLFFSTRKFALLSKKG